VGRKSSVVRAAAPIKAAIDRAVKDGTLSIDELRAWLLEQYPDAAIPSRSAIGRYRKNWEEVARDLREARGIADVYAQKMGDKQSDIGKVTLELLGTLNYRVSQAMIRSDDESIDTKALATLARAQQYIEDAGRMSLDREARVQKAALAAATKRMEKAAKQAGAGADTIDALRHAIMVEIAA
jgi:hypothetical protein